MSLPIAPMEICFSFDTTGSMNSCITHVKDRLKDLIQRLHGDVPGVRIAVIAHGDYCDSYVTKHIDFSTNAETLCDWISQISGTYGGDGDECYELVLQQVQSLSWLHGSKRALVMIGDADPHEPGYTYNGKTINVNWRDEIHNLQRMNVKVYGVQCSGYESTKNFYRTISTSTDGKCLQLEDLSNLTDLLIAIRDGKSEESLVQKCETTPGSKRKANEDSEIDESSCCKLRRADTLELEDTDPSTLTKVPSLKKPRSVQVLKPTSELFLRRTRNSRTQKPKARNTRLKYNKKRQEQLLEKYKLMKLQS